MRKLLPKTTQISIENLEMSDESSITDEFKLSLTSDEEVDENNS
jgi:hypothetical protein